MSEEKYTEVTEPFLKFEWRQNDLYELVLGMDDAREMFGLGGTGDEELMPRIKALLIAFPVLGAQIREGGEFIEGGAPGPMRVRQLEGKVLHRKEEK